MATDHQQDGDRDDLVSIGDAARELGVSVDTLRRWESDQKIAFVRTLGNHRRIRRSDLDALKASTR